jgi:hypothetical protein
VSIGFPWGPIGIDDGPVRPGLRVVRAGRARTAAAAVAVVAGDRKAPEAVPMARDEIGRWIEEHAGNQSECEGNGGG